MRYPKNDGSAIKRRMSFRPTSVFLSTAVSIGKILHEDLAFTSSLMVHACVVAFYELARQKWQ